MKLTPILFSTPMVQAILQGRKTKTRRIIKPQPEDNGVSYMPRAPLDWEQVYKEEWRPWKWDTEEGETIAKHCPYGEPGDVLWVREIFVKDSHYIYKADCTNELGLTAYGELTKWKPSIHMPFAACRLFLTVKSIRVERLQDISPEDAKAEGVEIGYCQQNNGPDLVTYLNYQTGKHEFISPVNSFTTLWTKINGEASWLANPWVWVIEFERTAKPSNLNT